MTTNELHAMVKELKEYKLLKEEAEARILQSWNPLSRLKCTRRNLKNGSRRVHAYSYNRYKQPY